MAPIIINDSSRLDTAGDVRVYDTAAAAELSLESYDAMDNWIHAFDSEGHVLKIVALKTGGARLEDA